MFPYYILIGIPAVTALVKVTKDGKKVRSMAPVHFFFGFLLLLLSLRGLECGIDLANYKILYRRSLTHSFGYSHSADGLEYGYHLLEFTLARMGFDFRVLLVLVALISLIPVWRFYSKKSVHPYLSILLFATIAPFSMYFSGLRQVIAMAFAPLAFHYAEKKKLIPFLLTVALAVLFHQSAFVMLVIYPLYRMKINKQTIYLGVPFIAVLLIFNKQIFSLLLLFLGNQYMDKYGEFTATGAYTTLILLVVFLLYAFIIPDENKLEEDVKGMRNILLLSVLIQSFAPIHTVAMRMNYYFLIFIPLLIPKVVLAAKDNNKKLASMSVAVLCVFFTLYFFFNAYMGADVLQIFPYVPFWS